MSAWTEFICEVIGVNNPIFFDIMSFSGLGETPGSIPWVKNRQISSKLGVEGAGRNWERFAYSTPIFRLKIEDPGCGHL